MNRPSHLLVMWAGTKFKNLDSNKCLTVWDDYIQDSFKGWLIEPYWLQSFCKERILMMKYANEYALCHDGLSEAVWPNNKYNAKY